MIYLNQDLYKISVNGLSNWAIKLDDSYEILAGDPFMDGLKGLKTTGVLVKATEVRTLPPTIDRVSKVLAFAYNYRSLTGDLGATQEPLFFLKSPTGLVGSNESVELPSFLEKTWVEVELALVVGKEGRNISANDVPNYVLGHTIGNDITSQNIYGRDHHLARSKGLDGFCPLGPFLRIGMPNSSLGMTTHVDGIQTQNGITDDRILGDCESLAIISRYVTLFPGDVILTGTPAGAMESVVSAGSTAVLRIDGLGELRTLFV